MINLVLIKMVNTQATLPSLHQLLSGDTFPSFSCGFRVNYSSANIFVIKSVFTAHPGPPGRLLGFEGEINTSRR